MTVTASEGEFQGYVIEWANQVIKQERLPFDRMTQFPGVKVGQRRREPDGQSERRPTEARRAAQTPQQRR
jgi:hypothetical protein